MRLIVADAHKKSQNLALQQPKMQVIASEWHENHPLQLPDGKQMMPNQTCVNEEANCFFIVIIWMKFWLHKAKISSTT